MKKGQVNLWISRFLIFMVVAWNLQCALTFLFNPGMFAQGFELSGIPGEAAMRGFAILFIMWNIPYLVALWQPRRNRLSLWEALIMQVIGVIGESFINMAIPAGHPTLHASILRFVLFDATGVACLIGAVLFSKIEAGK